MKIIKIKRVPIFGCVKYLLKIWKLKIPLTFLMLFSIAISGCGKTFEEEFIFNPLTEKDKEGILKMWNEAVKNKTVIPTKETEEIIDAIEETYEQIKEAEMLKEFSISKEIVEDISMKIGGRMHTCQIKGIIIDTVNNVCYALLKFN